MIIERDRVRELVESFVERKVLPISTECEEKEEYPIELVKQIGEYGFLCPHIPHKYGGSELDYQSIGIINEMIGCASASVRSILTVQGMVALAVYKYGTEEQKKKWLPKLASGEIIGGFALAEENAGSDSSNLFTTYQETENGYQIKGKKIWVTMGQLSDIFLVFARNRNNLTAFLVERYRDGIEVERVNGLLGLRATSVAEVTFSNVIIPKENLIGSEGIALRFIVPTCLDYGRFTVAWGYVGVSQACINECYSYTDQREQFGSKIKDFQMIQSFLAQMIALTKAARAMCRNAAEHLDSSDFNSIYETCLAKYFVSRACNKVASMAVQIMGANGCRNTYAIERYFRDAKISEIIEGSTQILEIIISNNYIEE